MIMRRRRNIIIIRIICVHKNRNLCEEDLSFLYIAQGESPRRLATALVGLVGPMRPNYWTSWTMVRMELHLQSDGVLQIFTEQ